jgi:hypothetical protein
MRLQLWLFLPALTSIEHPHKHVTRPGARRDFQAEVS